MASAMTFASLALRAVERSQITIAPAPLPAARQRDPHQETEVTALPIPSSSSLLSRNKRSISSPTNDQMATLPSNPPVTSMSPAELKSRAQEPPACALSSARFSFPPATTLPASATSESFCSLARQTPPDDRSATTLCSSGCMAVRTIGEWFGVRSSCSVSTLSCPSPAGRVGLTSLRTPSCPALTIVLVLPLQCREETLLVWYWLLWRSLSSAAVELLSMCWIFCSRTQRLPLASPSTNMPSPDMAMEEKLPSNSLPRLISRCMYLPSSSSCQIVISPLLFRDAPRRKEPSLPTMLLLSSVQ
mmetsp:Transcript_20647/g.69061  ORF Transcript_20647/g.69061 Transcript_20647/m.69061 type:complete len:303 (-) Transcript_20647:791-1699(-)